MRIIKAGLDATVARLAPCILPLKSRRFILCYHRLGYDQDSSASLFHNPVMTTPLAAFRQQMQWLSGFCQFLSLDELVDNADSNEQWRVAVTFDDGYRDNLELGLPVFEQYQIPVTLFTSTAYNDDPTLIPWWDLHSYINSYLENSLREHPKKLENLHRALSESDPERFLSSYNRADGPLSDWLCSELTLLNTRGPYHKAMAFNQLIQNALQQIIPSLQNEMLRPKQLQQFSRSPLVTTGLHTHTHPNLALLSEQQQNTELGQSIHYLKQWDVETSGWFAYPYGKPRHYTASTRTLLKESGIKGTVTTQANYVSSSSERYELPRFSVDGRWNLDTFKARILTGPVLNRIKQKLKR